MLKTYIFTSAACNYLPKTRQLLSSIRTHHPDFVTVLAMADEPAVPSLVAQEGWDEVLTIAQLEIEHWKRWAFSHDIVELSTAIKPFALKRLLSRPDCGRVIYLDPDIVIFSPMGENITAHDNNKSIVLTPHQTSPEQTLAGIMNNEICSLKHGIYNLGFISVAPDETGLAFADWWARRCYLFCRAEIPNGLFTDQRWIDLVPALFPNTYIECSPRYNVAPWNISNRNVTGDFEQGFSVNGEPLSFYHFTGLDSGAHVMALAGLMTSNPAVATLVHWYMHETGKTKDDPLSRQPWAFSRFSDGTPITRGHRLVYRNRGDIQEMFPDPFFHSADASDTFLKWCKTRGKARYGHLLNAETSAAELASLTDRLIPSTSNVAHETVSAMQLARDIFKRPSLLPAVAQKVLRLYHREGLTGIRKHLLGRKR